jgi:hypothetical protein
MGKTAKALYVFCFARSALVGELEGTGVDGRHPLSVFRPFLDICAVLSEVAREDFCGPAAEQQMQKLAWVAPRALRHEAVVEQVMRYSPVLPTRFGTLFSSQESLARFLDVHLHTIAQFLARVAYHEEWSIKGLLDRTLVGQGLISARLAAQQERLAALPPGTRYFHEQRIRSAAEKELSSWLGETCRQLASDLLKQASDFRDCPLGPPQPPETSPPGRRGGAEVVAHWALLLPRGATAALHLLIDRANAKYTTNGLAFEVSGPWPPYRFVPNLYGPT